MFYIGAGIYLIGGTFYFFLSTSDIQPWAIRENSGETVENNSSDNSNQQKEAVKNA